MPEVISEIMPFPRGTQTYFRRGNRRDPRWKLQSGADCLRGDGLRCPERAPAAVAPFPKTALAEGAVGRAMSATLMMRFGKSPMGVVEADGQTRIYLFLTSSQPNISMQLP